MSNKVQQENPRPSTYVKRPNYESVTSRYTVLLYSFDEHGRLYESTDDLPLISPAVVMTCPITESSRLTNKSIYSATKGRRASYKWSNHLPSLTALTLRVRNWSQQLVFFQTFMLWRVTEVLLLARLGLDCVALCVRRYTKTYKK